MAEAWPPMWTVTRGRFEEVLVAKWQQMSTKTPRAVFIQNFAPELKLFLEHGPFEAALEAETQKKEIPVAVLVKLLRQHVGQQLFQVEAQHAKWHSFVQSTEGRLKDLLHLDCTSQAYGNFVAASKVALKDLLSSGFAAYGKYEVACAFYGRNYKVQVAGLHEVPTVMFQLLLRQVVVNCKQVQAMPWEEHLLEMTGGSIPNIPTAIQVDKKLFQNIALGREVLQRAVKDCTTYDAFAREMRLARDSIRAVDPHFALEEEFFALHVPAMVEKHVYDKVLAALPGGELDPSDASKVIGQGEAAYKRIAGIQACAMVRHSLPAVGRAVGGAMMILRAMLDGEALAMKAVVSSSEFHQSVYRQCANFLVYEQPSALVALGQPRFFYGQAAMSHHIAEMDRAREAARLVEMSALKVFRQFRWLLSQADDARIQKNMVEERRKRQNFLENCMIKDASGEESARSEAATHSNAKAAAAGAAGLPALTAGGKGEEDRASTAAASSADGAAAAAPPTKKHKGQPKQQDDMDERLSLFLPKRMAQAKSGAQAKTQPKK